MSLRRIILSGVALGLVVLGPAPALGASDPLSYDDPGMHFRPPDGWERLSLGDPGPDQSGNRPPVAAYVLKKSKYDQRLITISVQPFTGSLDGFVNSHTNDLRARAESTFVEKQEKTKLSNGMPAVWLKVNQRANLGQYVRRYEYLVFDLTRSIVVSYTGRAGDFDEKEAKDALASLYVVVYPHTRS